jgi:excinuclease UvrABC ATPase subunit
MAQSTCIKCDNHSFELKELKVAQANFKLFAVQCSSCGGVVGIQEYMNIGSMLHKQNQALKLIAAKLGTAVALD